MDLALIILKTGETFISQTEQLEYEPKVHLQQPYQVGGKTKVTLTSWPEYTEDEHILLHSDSLLTVCEPTTVVRDAYLKKINKTLEDFQSKEEGKVLLNEDEQMPTIDDYDDDHGYEPAYQET